MSSSPPSPVLGLAKLDLSELRPGSSDVTLVTASDGDALHPHTPRFDESWFATADEVDGLGLVAEAMRPGLCGLPDSREREWLQKRLTMLGHRTNDAGHYLMAHTWFECAYAAKADYASLLSSVNMRMRMGQLGLAKQLYSHILALPDLADAQQREIAERKLEEAQSLLAGGHRTTKSGCAGEAAQLLQAARPEGAAPAHLPMTEAPRVLQLVRLCGHAANRARDFESAQLWCAAAPMREARALAPSP